MISIFWFRRDLRLEDNAGLYHALRGETPVLPLFIFDTDILGKLSAERDARVEFIHKNLLSIDKQLKEKGSGLLVRHGQPIEVWTDLISSYKIRCVYTNNDYEPYARDRDREVGNLLVQNGIEFHTFKDQVIFEQSEIVKDDGTPYTVYTPYSKKWRNNLTPQQLKPFNSEQLFQNLYTAKIPQIPALSEIGFKPSGIEIPDKNINETQIRNYHLTRNIPAVNGTSRIGIHLRFGTVSIRKTVRLALELNDTWLAELIWREFFMMILYHFPHVITKPFKAKYAAIPWRQDSKAFKIWQEGKTGFPIVDAGMRELNSTGFMHNRTRMITASFLTKLLLIDWRWGEAYFAEKLLDYELAANNGNWQWAAGCGCDAAPYFRIFNPYTQADKFDPEQQYIRRWLPEFGTFDYPKPIINYKVARERALEVYAMALEK